MLPLVAVSGAECSEALTLAGFRVRECGGDAMTLVRGMRRVEVPDIPILHPDELHRVLREAGIVYTHFLELLSRAPSGLDARRTQSGVRRRVVSETG